MCVWGGACSTDRGNKREGDHAAKEQNLPQRVLRAKGPEKHSEPYLARGASCVAAVSHHSVREAGVWWWVGRERKGRWEAGGASP